MKKRIVADEVVRVKEKWISEGSERECHQGWKKVKEEIKWNEESKA